LGGERFLEEVRVAGAGDVGITAGA
jgi:hypothetical protein